MVGGMPAVIVPLYASAGFLGVPSERSGYWRRGRALARTRLARPHSACNTKLLGSYETPPSATKSYDETQKSQTPLPNGENGA